eukprot:GHVQ01017820.1.p1 GENE.GHVQ01017820.1~~GHVQ01017820.1.p1  ORF type:complete len:133 (-),score=5.91 GHVQ01017820.1:55-453(-)
MDNRRQYHSDLPLIQTERTRTNSSKPTSISLPSSLFTQNKEAKLFANRNDAECSSPKTPRICAILRPPSKGFRLPAWARNAGSSIEDETNGQQKQIAVSRQYTNRQQWEYLHRLQRFRPVKLIGHGIHKEIH